MRAVGAVGAVRGGRVPAWERARGGRVERVRGRVRVRARGHGRADACVQKREKGSGPACRGEKRSRLEALGQIVDESGQQRPWQVVGLRAALGLALATGNPSTGSSCQFRLRKYLAAPAQLKSISPWYLGPSHGSFHGGRGDSGRFCAKEGLITRH